MIISLPIIGFYASQTVMVNQRKGESIVILGFSLSVFLESI